MTTQSGKSEKVRCSLFWSVQMLIITPESLDFEGIFLGQEKSLDICPEDSCLFDFYIVLLLDI